MVVAKDYNEEQKATFDALFFQKVYNELRNIALEGHLPLEDPHYCMTSHRRSLAEIVGELIIEYNRGVYGIEPPTPEEIAAEESKKAGFKDAAVKVLTAPVKVPIVVFETTLGGLKKAALKLIRKIAGDKKSEQPKPEG